MKEEYEKKEHEDLKHSKPYEEDREYVKKIEEKAHNTYKKLCK